MLTKPMQLCACDAAHTSVGIVGWEWDGKVWKVKTRGGTRGWISGGRGSQWRVWGDMSLCPPRDLENSFLFMLFRHSLFVSITAAILWNIAQFHWQFYRKPFSFRGKGSGWPHTGVLPLDPTVGIPRPGPPRVATLSKFLYTVHANWVA